MNAYRLINSSHSEVAPCLPLPNLPICFGTESNDATLRIDAGNESFVISQASKIAELLAATDISYLCLREESRRERAEFLAEAPPLYSAVLGYDAEAFACATSGPFKDRGWHSLPSDKRHYQRSYYGGFQSQTFSRGTSSSLLERSPMVSTSARKPRMKRKNSMLDAEEKDNSDNFQDGSIQGLCDLLDEYLQKTEILGEPEGEEDGAWFPISELKQLSNEIAAAHSRNMLHHIPSEKLIRLLNLLDRHIQQGHDIMVDEDDDVDSEQFYTVMSSLESVHIALTIMTHQDMPKQVYNEEIIERIVSFSRNQILQNVFAVYDCSYKKIYKSKAGTTYNEDDDDEDPGDFGTSRKSRRRSRAWTAKRASLSKSSNTVSVIVQKLCTILGLLKELLVVERLLDSSVLLLIKTSLMTLTIDNIQLLQLKAIGVICAVFSCYTQHRAIILDELFQLLWKLPSSKRGLRSYHLPDEEQKQIQMITALLVQMVQCSVILPKASEEAGAAVDMTSCDNGQAKCSEVAEFCMRFWKTVLQRWASVKAQDGSEIKGVVDNIVVDLLSILNVPEYPAAGLLLQVLCVLLFGDNGLKSKDAVVRGMAIDLLGQIAAKLKSDAVSYKKDKLWVLQELNGGSKPDGSWVERNTCSACLVSKGSKSAVYCDECKRTFHGDCIGISCEDMVTQRWMCHFCICRRQLSSLIESKQNHAENKQLNVENMTKHLTKTSTQISGIDVVQQIVLNYLQESCLTDDSSKYAARFCSWQWYMDDPNPSKSLSYYQERLNLRNKSQECGVSVAPLSRNVISRISAALGQQWKLARGFDKILEILLISLKENAPTLRAKALRAVSAIVEADPEVLGDKRVQCAVEGRFLDSAISVREAAMELVGRHIASHPDVAMQYFDKVTERIMDTGVSVRKRVIKIIRDMCISKCAFNEATAACVRMISRINDEEASIQDLVCRTFYELWFEDSSEMQISFVNGEYSVPPRIAERTEQLVDVLRKLQNHQPLVTIIKRSLTLDFLPQNARTAGVAAASQLSVRNCCELMCLCLLERILQAEEANNNESDIRTLPYILALHAFCTVDPTICAPASDPFRFVITLQPYLKNQNNNRDVAQLLQSIVFVIDAVLPLVRRPPPNFIEDLEHDLKQMIVQHSFITVVHACIRCLCSLRKYTAHGASSFERLVRGFYKQLERYKNSFESKDKEIVLRGLFCLGLLVRYGAQLMVLSNKEEISIENIVLLFKHYLRSDDFNIKVRALQALGFVFIAKPEFMMEKDVGKIMEATLSPGSDPNIKLQTLRNLYDYLLDNEEQMGMNDPNGPGNYRQTNAGTVPVAAGAGDNNFCGGIIQMHWNSILERCLDVNDQVRQSALKVVEIVLRQGLVHPITCVPYLVALEVDQHESNSKMAHRLLMHMNEKYPSFFESRLGDGLQLSFRFIQSGASVSGQTVSPAKASGSLKCKQDNSVSAAAKVGISRIYKLIKGSRISRNKFLSSIIRKFDFAGLSYTPVLFLVYCAEILAALPFTLPDEPLYLVYAINRILQVRGGSLEAEMKSLITDSPFSGIANRISEPRVTMASFDGHGVHGVEYNELTDGGLVDSIDVARIPDTYLQRMKACCYASIAMVLLLKLKRHLKIVYSLNDARCQAFSPTESIKHGEPFSRQSIPFGIDDTPLTLPTSVHEMLQQYQEFKRLLKEDALDYSVHTAHTPKKRARHGGPNTQSSKDGQMNGHVPMKVLRTRLASSVPRNENGGSDGSENEEHGDDDWTNEAVKRGRISSTRGRSKRHLL